MNAASQYGPGTPRSAAWALIGLFVAPLAVAFVLYYGLSDWRPAGRTNHGELISPARELPRLAFDVREVGAQLRPPLQLFEDKWSFVFIGQGSCDARCRKALTDMRQVRLALNENTPRVQRIFVPIGECCADSYLQQEHRGLLIATLPAAELQRFLAAFPTYADGAPAAAGRLYVVDPLGNLMMSYGAQSPAKGLLEDTKKLLKLSRIG